MGETMENTTVLQESDVKTSEGRYPSQIVLRQIKEKRYATHLKILPPAGEPSFILGRYFFTLADAEKDFRKREIELNAL